MAGRESLVAGEVAGYERDLGAALWRLEDARRRTLDVLKEVRPGHVDAQAAGNTIGTILYHLALIETDWLYAEIVGKPVPGELMSLLPADDRDREGVLTAVRGQSLEEHMARLQAVRAALLEEVRGMTTEDFHRARSLPQYDVSPAWVLHHLAQHEAEHRGELGSVLTILRSPEQPGTAGGGD